MYKKNDMIVYGSQGVCTVTDIVQKDGIEYYVLTPHAVRGATVFVPTASSILVEKMHPVLSEQEVYNLIEAMPDADSTWTENETERKEQYKKILSGGDRAELVRQIKLIYLHKKELNSKKKKLHNCDEQFFNIAEKLLYDEFSYVLNIKRDEVIPLITQHLNQG